MKTLTAILAFVLIGCSPNYERAVVDYSTIIGTWAHTPNSAIFTKD